MVMLAEHYDFVIGGDPDRDTLDLAVLDTGGGRVLAHVADTADGAGYQRMLAWAGEHADGRRVWALEGTGSFAAGLVVFLVEAGEAVVEVVRSSGPEARRTTASTRSALPVKHCLERSRPRRAPVVCARRCGWFSPAEKGFY